MAEAINWEAVDNNDLIAEATRRGIYLLGEVGRSALTGDDHDVVSPQATYEVNILFMAEAAKKTAARGETILRTNQDVTSVAFLESGYVVSYPQLGGNRGIQFIHKAGEIFPLRRIFSDEVEGSDLRYDALSDVTYRFLPKALIREFAENDSGIGRSLSEQMSEHISAMTERVITLGIQNAYHRVASTIAFMGTRYGEVKLGGLVIPLSLGQQQLIAESTALTRETVSRIMGKLKNSGLVTHNDHRQIVIPDLSALMAEVSK